jgi:hypothetical protein
MQGCEKVASFGFVYIIALCCLRRFREGEGVQRNRRLCPDDHHKGGAACPFQGCSTRGAGGGQVPWLPRAIVRMREEDREDDKKCAILSCSAVRAALVRAASWHFCQMPVCLHSMSCTMVCQWEVKYLNMMGYD